MGRNMLIVTHEACLKHDLGTWHPESPARLQAVRAGIDDFMARRASENRARLRAAWIGIEDDYGATRDTEIVSAPYASSEALLRVHTAAYIDWLEQQFPNERYVQLDDDTLLSPGSREAAYRAAGAVELAASHVLSGTTERVFCAVRPPGHHAEPERAMGFCLFNNLAVGVAAALAAGVERVAIVDFDVHHGNGTEAAFAGDERVLLCSLFEHPLYPNSGLEPADNCLSVPLPAGTDGLAYRMRFGEIVEPALTEFAPQLVFVSAGFDAHAGDPLADLLLEDEDYAWLTERIVAVAESSAEGRVISVLEGGYNLDALRGATVAHLLALDGRAGYPDD